MFYVYAYLDPRKPGKYEYKSICFLYEPFYIGKGKGRRIFKHELKPTPYNSFKNSKIKKIKEASLESIKVIINTTEVEQEALNMEIQMISEIGRSHVRGPLTNMTDGGDGVSGYKPTQEVFEKTGLYKMNLLGGPWKGKNVRKELIKKYGLDQWNKRYDKLKGKPTWNTDSTPIIQLDKNGNIIKEWDGLSSLIKLNPNFQKSNIVACANGRRKTAHGFKWEYKQIK